MRPLEAVRLANKVAAAHPPYQRQSRCDAWCREVRLTERDHPEITGLGLTLAYSQFSDDLRALGRFVEEEQPSPSKGVRRLVPTETGDRVNVFISHKAEDAALARSIKKIMEVYAGGRLVLHISEEMPGADLLARHADELTEDGCQARRWSRSARTQLARAHSYEASTGFGE